MAWAAKYAHTTFPDSIVAVRFLGTSSHSFDIVHLLQSLCSQLAHILLVDGHEKEKSAAIILEGKVQDLAHHFVELLGATKGKKVFIFLDSLDQLLPVHGAHTLDWLPLDLPEGVHMVVSLISEGGHVDLLSVLRAKRNAPPEEFICAVPLLAPSELEQVANARLSAPDAHGRAHSLTSAQRDLVLQKSSATPTPLYLAMAMDFALGWKSYTPIHECILAPTVRGLVLQAFR